MKNVILRNMPNFKNSNIIFIVIIALLIIAKFLFGFSTLWLLIPFIIYSFSVFLGVKNICSQFFLNVQCVSDDKSKIHLTFDDGPHPIITPQILEVLKSHNQKAIFFCIGKNIEQYPEIIKQIIEQGHEIGNHSYSHSIGFDFMSTKKVSTELEKTNDLIKQFTGKSNHLFRPPFGVTNPNIAKAVKQLGMKTIGWSIRSLDSVKSKPVIMKRIQKANLGDIVLFHDTKEHTLEILEEFLRSIGKESTK
jgi:peptidoglycan/xylan/chitin deacetylase (PgdA/CDA1 family)